MDAEKQEEIIGLLEAKMDVTIEQKTGLKHVTRGKNTNIRLCWCGQ